MLGEPRIELTPDRRINLDRESAIDGVKLLPRLVFQGNSERGRTILDRYPENSQDSFRRHCREQTATSDKRRLHVVEIVRFLSCDSVNECQPTRTPRRVDQVGTSLIDTICQESLIVTRQERVTKKSLCAIKIIL